MIWRVGDPRPEFPFERQRIEIFTDDGEASATVNPRPNSPGSVWIDRAIHLGNNKMETVLCRLDEWPDSWFWAVREIKNDDDQ